MMKRPPSDIFDYLVYDRRTGTFVWRIAPSNVVRAGTPAGARVTKGYVSIGFRGQYYRAHRLVWLVETGQWPTQVIDHRNGVTDDNRFENLRLATLSLNRANSKHGGVFPKGVSIDRTTGRFRARISIDRKSISLGQFDTPVEAHRAYCDAAVKHFGEFARFE